MKKELKNLLVKLQLYKTDSIIVPDSNNKYISTTLGYDLENKLNKISPNAVYIFHQQPYLLFFDLTGNVDKNRETEIQKQVWSFDQAPVIFIINDNDIEIYNAFAYEKNKGLEKLNISDEERNKQFSFWNLQSGKTFDWFYEKYKRTIHKKRVNQQLFKNIKDAITILTEKHKLDEKIAKLLVLRLIFVRYLIDRKIKIDKSYIEGNENEIFVRRKSFSVLIANHEKLHKFFDYLDERFNGVLFKKENIGLTRNQAQLLSSFFKPAGISDIEKADLFSGTDFDPQFDVFDFGIIPVELISGIYETLLDPATKDATSAIYTPPFLVNYILTQTVDKYFEANPTKSECKIFDPAMGSGIFLVQSLRKMIEREQELNPKQSKKVFGERIKKIAQNNLFGIDINEEAINVACFSVYVALLDYQEPGDVDVYKFPNLKDKNFFKVHFFDLEKEDISDKIKAENVQFILGNPPWKSNNSPEHLNWLKQTKFDKVVSDKQIAQSFMIRVKDFSLENPQIALIVTSKVFYNNKAQKFKQYFLQNNRISEIVDMSAVRRLVFEDADNPGAIIFFENNINQKESNSKSVIKHISLKQNKFFNKFTQNIVIEKFDQKEILQKHFIENEWMFKVALYGNTLDFVFLSRKQSDNYTISKFLDTKPGNGIHKGTSKNYHEELIDLPIIETNDIQRFYTPISETTKKLEKKDVYLEGGRNINLFKGSKLLFTRRTKEETEISVSLCEGDAVFRNSAYGLPLGTNNKLISQIYSALNSKFYTYYQYLTSSNWGVYNPEINLYEHLSFPFIEPSESQSKKLISLVDELLKPYKEFYKENPSMVYNGKPSENVLNQINAIINEIYNINGYELDLIDYVLKVSRYQFQESKQYLVSDFNKDDYRNQTLVLKQYANVYIQEFERIYDESNFYIEAYILDSFIAMNFIISDEKIKDKEQFEIIKEVTKEAELFNKISSLSIEQIASSTDDKQNLFIQKDIKGFEENSFYILKPNEYKCWHRAMAWYDVAEFKEAIQRAELERIRLRNE